MKRTGYPPLKPNKPERMTTPFPDCGAELLITDGVVAKCKNREGAK